MINCTRRKIYSVIKMTQCHVYVLDIGFSVRGAVLGMQQSMFYSTGQQNTQA